MKRTFSIIILLLALIVFVTYTGCDRIEAHVRSFIKRHITTQNRQTSVILHRPNGIDVSHHQGTIDWKAVARDGRIQYAYIKATEGATYKDPHYKRNLEGARKGGMLVGSYHYFRTTSSAHEQFENFKRAVPKDKQDLIPMVDIEERKHWTRDQFQDSLKVFMRLMEQHYGKAPMIYSVQSFFSANASPEFNSHPLMLGRYNSSNPPVIKGKGHYTIWQFSERGKIPGISRYVDLSKFHPDCSIEDLKL